MAVAISGVNDLQLVGFGVVADNCLMVDPDSGLFFGVTAFFVFCEYKVSTRYEGFVCYVV